jgi:hypothetical protein
MIFEAIGVVYVESMKRAARVAQEHAEAQRREAVEVWQARRIGANCRNCGAPHESVRCSYCLSPSNLSHP